MESIARLELGNANNLIDKYLDIEFDLIITSPPYNIGKEYEVRKSITEYLDEQRKIISKLIDRLSPQGSICWQVGNYIDEKHKEIYPFSE